MSREELARGVCGVQNFEAIVNQGEESVPASSRILFVSKISDVDVKVSSNNDR